MMKKIILYLGVFFLCFMTLEGASKHKLTIVSLGADCQAAVQLRKNNLREEAYPFDWAATIDFESVILAIADDFNHWLDPSLLVYKEISIYNTYYNMNFVHDFPYIDHIEEIFSKTEISRDGLITPDYINYLPLVEEKYDRRIRRFKKLLESKGPVIFIRTNTSPAAARHFVELIKFKYPKLNFLLVALTGKYNYFSTDLDLYNYNWGIENVINIYCPGEGVGTFKMWWDDNVWKDVFKQLGLNN